MLERLKTYLLWALGLGLPWHGAITVFGPEILRWWKEGALALLLLVLLFSGLKNYKLRITNYELSLRSKILNLLSPCLWAVLFLVWGVGLALINSDVLTALVALRYLGLGLFAFLLGYGLWKSTLISVKNGYEAAINLFHNFCTALTCGVLSSTLFGLWAKFAGGYEILSAWYSTTISSWVPGQLVPLYHQTGDFIRLQGASSGPIEYSHLAVLALWYVLFFKLRITNWELGMKVLSNARIRNLLLTTCYLLPAALLLFGIAQSGSRAAMLGALILLTCWVGREIKNSKFKIQNFHLHWSADKLAAGLLLGIVLLAMTKLTLSPSVLGNMEFMNKKIIRISDVDHLQRPLEAFKMALSSPWEGNLGALGPAARAKNLAEYNNDQAPIAESVPFDVLAQLGVVGFCVWLVFWLTVWRNAPAALRWLVVAFVPLMLLATIFDMTPMALSFFLVLGLGLAWPQRRCCQTADLETVFDLKNLAFRSYVEQVWGWNKTEQKKLVTQEIKTGQVELVRHEGRVVATFLLDLTTKPSQLFSFYVHPAHQSAGLGAVIMRHFLPAGALDLQVLKVNPRAKSFYEQQGFTTVGQDQHHWLMHRKA